MLVDTHAHLDLLAERGTSVDDALARARQSGVGRIITIGIDTASSRRAVALAEEHGDVYAAIGVHPHDAADFGTESEKQLRALAAHEKVVAIGEIGLDYHRDGSPRDRQRHAFRLQLELAADVGLPACIHSREASEDVMRVLAEDVRGPERMVMHCFSGDGRLAAKMVDLGCHISLAGPVTFANAAKAAEVAATVPLDRLLLETDCPYLAPQPYRGKTNEPAHLGLIAAKVAELRGMTLAALADATTANAERLFRFPSGV